MEDKSYVKISKQDYDIAESFFQNDKHLDEFISNVSRYYCGKNLTIKTKIVQRYFETYKKTMDFVINARNFGKVGGVQRVNNQSLTETTLEGYIEGVSKIPSNQIVNSKVINNNSKKEIKNKDKNINGSTEPVDIDFIKLKEYWNNKAVRVSKILTIDSVREKSIKSLVKKHGKVVFFTALKNMLESEFHNLDLSQSWKGNFDWILKPANFKKMLELDNSVEKKSEKIDKSKWVFG